MKKALWFPLALGVGMGLLAGVALVAGLSFTVTRADNTDVVGFHMTAFLLAAALGGPLAGAIAPATQLAFVSWFGPAELRGMLSDPLVFWSNSLVVGAFMTLIGLGYRALFERLNLPGRLLSWVGVVFVFYALHPSILFILQNTPADIGGALTRVPESLQNSSPQMLFDIIFTSLVFVALPPSFSRPLWYASKKAPAPRPAVPGQKRTGAA